MPKPKTKYYRCTKRPRCELANKRQTIETIDGKRSLPCPLLDAECERSCLREIDPPKQGVPRVLIVSLAAAVVVIALAIFLWPKSNSESKPGSVEAALQEVWPWLK